MIVTCEGCETGFHVDERLLRPGGSKVRCSKCRHVFVAYPPAPAEDSEEPLVLSEEMPPVARDGTGADMASIAAKLDDLFEETAAASDSGPAAVDPELLDVDDLMAEEPSPPAGSMSEASELDLNFDLGLDPAPSGSAGEASLTPEPLANGQAAEEEIDFNLDLEPSAAEADTALDLPELDELELDLAALDAAGDDTAQPVAEKDSGAAAASELELGLDFDLPLEKQSESSDPGSASAAAETPGAAAAGPSLDLLNELNLDLDSVPDATKTTLAKDAERKNLLAETDEIDLSDLENMLDGSPPPAADASAGEEPLFGEKAGVEPAETPSDLDLSFLTETADHPLPAESDAEAPEPSVAPESKELATSDELDFSDLSSLLEHDDAKDEKIREIEDVELVLDSVPSAAETAAAPSEEMLDIEAFLTGDSEDSDTAEEGDAGLEQAAETTPVASTDLEIEFEPAAEVEAEAAGSAARATTAVGAAAPGPGTDEFATEEAVAAGATDVMEAEPAVEAPAVFKKPPIEAGRHSGGLLKALGGVVLVLVLALAALVVPRGLGIHIPYLTDTDIPVLSEIDLEVPFIGNVGKLFKTETADPVGRLKILPDAGSVAAEFVENPVAGRLLVVKGKLRNAYDHPRSAIRVSATLIAKGGAPIRTTTVYAGNVLSGQELAALDVNAIQARLQISTGTANSNVGVKPGGSLPFMVVFDQLPANIDEYSVEVAGSKK